MRATNCNARRDLPRPAAPRQHPEPAHGEPSPVSATRDQATARSTCRRRSPGRVRPRPRPPPPRVACLAEGQPGSDHPRPVRTRTTPSRSVRVSPCVTLSESRRVRRSPVARTSPQSIPCGASVIVTARPAVSRRKRNASAARAPGPSPWCPDRHRPRPRPDRHGRRGEATSARPGDSPPHRPARPTGNGPRPARQAPTRTTPQTARRHAPGTPARP